MYEAQAPDGTVLRHRTTNTTKRKAAMVVVARDGKWQPQDVYEWPPYTVCDWVTSGVVLARRVADVQPNSNVQPDPGEAHTVPPPPVVPYTPSAEFKALVLKHYDPTESLASQRPMFRDRLGTMVLEVFARQNSVQPTEVERVLEEFGLPAHASPGWAERVLDELGRLVPDAEAESRVKALQGEVATLRQEIRTLTALLAAPICCPNCGATSVLLTEQLPEHDIFEFRCQACQTQFRAA
jgi:hypothetical protein